MLGAPIINRSLEAGLAAKGEENSLEATADCIIVD